MPKALVTSGPTIEKLDPVRFISNFSSGKQGHAIARSLCDAGFEVTLICGPVNIDSPPGVKTINVNTAQEMLDCCIASLPVDVAVFAAAVCDFRPEAISANKIKKALAPLPTWKQFFKRALGNKLFSTMYSLSIRKKNAKKLTLNLIENQDILKTICNHSMRPRLVVGFAAETENLIGNAMQKLNAKKCDIIVANDVSSGAVFGSDSTCITIISKDKVEPLGTMSKRELADILVSKICKLM